MQEDSDSHLFEFAGFSVDVVRRQLLKNGEPVAITSKAFDTLLFLIRHRGATISKADLMNAVWADTAVEENNLTQQISALRRALGERPNEHRFIVTVPGRGYSFVAAIESEMVKIARPASHFDAAVLRGYAAAMSFVLLIGIAFVWSGIRGNDRQSLAVLTFRAADRGDEFVGVGISETLRARLGSVEDLIVRPAPADVDTIAAGRRLEVDTVVTGSVQRDGGRIRVVVEMVNVSDGRIVWGRTFDATSSDVFELQDTIAGEVASAINAGVSSRSSLMLSPLFESFI